MVDNDTANQSAPGWYAWHEINKGYSDAAAMVAAKRPKWALALTCLPVGVVLGLLSVLGVQLLWIVVAFVLIYVSIAGAHAYGRAKGQELLVQFWREKLDAGDPNKRFADDDPAQRVELMAAMDDLTRPLTDEERARAAERRSKTD